ncbi:MAG: hypothetical protein LBN04_03310 [Oscillospiraceae bacterium]|nr:hypothetical protein [Oscillospiraceae bacterium]
MKKIIACAMLVLLCLGAIGAAHAETIAIKDETVYALLDATGAQKQILIVNHLDTPTAGEYVDHGQYKSLQAMTQDVQPLVSGDAIIWTLPADPAGFFAVGEPASAALPFLLDMTYTLDGQAIAPDALAGQSGRVQIALAVRANPEAAPFSTRYAAQVQWPLSVGVCENIDAPGATIALVGGTRTLSFTVLPGQDAAFTIAFDATLCQWDSPTIACAPMDVVSMLGGNISAMMASAPAQIDQMVAGATALSGGVSAYVQGAEAAIGGMGEAAGRLSSAITALNDLLAALPEAERAAAQTQLVAMQAAANAIARQAETFGTQADGASLTSGASAQQRALTSLQSMMNMLLSQVPQAGAETAIPSFADAQHPARSVQFVYRVDGMIPMDAVDTSADAGETMLEEGFWDRLLGLFD